MERWKNKVFAFLHDPGEKALILLRGVAHDKGTVEKMRRELLGDELFALRGRLAPGCEAVVKRADWWSSAADRPSLPARLKPQRAFVHDPQIVHPLTGECVKLPELASDEDMGVARVEALGFDHLKGLIVRDGGGDVDWRKTFLALWRFAPENPAPGLRAFWEILPADTRSPDHTIWEHLSLSSALAGAFTGSGPALFTVSLGPVQRFIAQARSLSDLWAGSHFLSQLAWEAIRVVCERYGPDVVVYPSLRGVPAVDLWLKAELGEHWPEAFVPVPDCITDETHPVFVAALPNRFVAVVPEDEAPDLARAIEARVRKWAREKALAALRCMAEAAEFTGIPAEAEQQVTGQMAGFPEVYWAVVPWHLAGTDILDDRALRDLRKILGLGERYLEPRIDGIVRREIEVEGHPFFRPNPGVAYPGLMEAMNQLLDAAKSARRFDGAPAEGYRCTLCGEREWLTADRALLHVRPGQVEGQGEPLWGPIARNAPYLAKEGERLCAWCSLKRAWPDVFASSLGEGGDGAGRVRRYNVSTRAMALSTTLWGWLEAREARQRDPEVATRAERAKQALRASLVGAFGEREKRWPRASWPRRLWGRLPAGERDFVSALPALLDLVEEEDLDDAGEGRGRLTGLIKDFFGAPPETYYGLVLMDGDRLGKLLSEGGAAFEEEPVTLGSRFHRETHSTLQGVQDLEQYLMAPRPPSPAWHQAVSTALNGFALRVARYVVEQLFLGKLIYAGGDDLLALVSVRDLPGLMWTLRCAYAGELPKPFRDRPEAFWEVVSDYPVKKFLLRKGFARVPNGEPGNGNPDGDKAPAVRLLRLMGDRATASMGAVVGHHKAPLGRVLGELRDAERAAKDAGGRDAFCIAVHKRSGGATRLIGKWALEDSGGGDMAALLGLRNLFAGPVARRAAYQIIDALQSIPETQEALTSLLLYQFRRHVEGAADGERLERVARSLAERALAKCGGRSQERFAARWLAQVVTVAEFLAREGRAPTRREGGEA